MGAMQSLSRILLVVERDQRVHAGLAKALSLARHTGAGLELFLCDTPYAEASAGDSSSLPSERRRQQQAYEYLRSLRHCIVSSDVRIEMQAARAHSLIQGIIERLRHEPAQLVVRTRSHASGTSTTFARQLLQAGTPLVLTQGQPWHPSPQFMTALLIEDRADGKRASALLPSAGLPELLSRACGARMDYVIAAANVLASVARRRDYDLITVITNGAEDGQRSSRPPYMPDLSGIGSDILFVGASPRPSPAESADACGRVPI